MQFKKLHVTLTIFILKERIQSSKIDSVRRFDNPFVK